MKFGVPWSVKGIRPEARETAKEAARRSGMPLGEWLNSVILQQAEEDGVRAHAYDRDDEDSYGDDLSSVHQRLDDITRRIEQFTRSGPAAYAPKHSRNERGRNDNDQQLAQLIARLDRRLEQFVQMPQMMAQYAPAPAAMPRLAVPSMGMPRPANPHMMPAGLDRAVAEIAARQRALNGNAAPAPATSAAPPPQAVQQAYVPAPALVPVPTQDLSGLEEHLRQITDQIETLRRPGVEDAINALRDELGDIGRALNEAMPRKAIDTIERQIQGLTQRIAEGRQSGNIAGVDGGALSGIEHGLAEVRDALRGLTPAESLVGFNGAVDGLARKIDLIVAQRDPESIGQLEHAITTLREMATHVASNEAVSGLAAQVQMLGDKVEQFTSSAGAGDALNNLEHRIGALADALAERTQSGATVPPRLEALVESLSDKIEQIQQSRGDTVAATHLEDQIVALVQRLDASDSRLGHLEAIERGLADLLVHIEEMRANKSSGGVREENTPGVLELKSDIARTQDALNAVHGTLGLVVDRLATMEKDFRGAAHARSPADPDSIEIDRPVGKIAARAVVDPPPQAPQPAPPPVAAAPVAPPHVEPAAPMPAPPAPQPAPPQTLAPPTPAPAPQPAAPKRLPPAAHLPINPNLPPDQPLEPGSGPPRFIPNPAARIAASEAALGGARPGAATGPAGKSGFIAAARRAAQAALETATPNPPPAEPTDADERENSSLRGSVMKKVKSLFIAASIVAVVIGGIQIAGNVMDFGSSRISVAQNTDESRTDLNADPKTDAGGSKTAAATMPTAPAPSNLAANTSVPLDTSGILPGYMSPAPAVDGGVLASKAPLIFNPNAPGSPSLFNMPATKPPAPAATNDVTGSIPSATGKARVARPSTPPPQEAERLPTAIGGTQLRNAADAGDPAAAYEVAQRFSEGRGVPTNLEEAARWYERAAGKGLAPAQFRYASMLEKGQGVKKNLGLARRLYLAAATKGHAKAMHNLAVLYAEGIEGKPDYATAVTWFRKAAEHGIADSQYNLGVLCTRGLGTNKDMAEAYKWFALAAAQGDRESAKKRDDVAAHLDADALAAAERSAAGFVAAPQPHDAIAVPVPRGGWDNATNAAPPARTKPHSARAVSANMPLNTSEVGRR
jgi:localization factor PodJL